MYPGLGTKIIFAILIFGIVFSVCLTAYVSIDIFISRHVGECNVTNCTVIAIEYLWETDPYYRQHFDIPTTWDIGCPDVIKCSYNEKDPYGTFGGWVVESAVYGEPVCMNGACLISNTWGSIVFYILVTTIVIFFGVLVGVTITVCTTKPHYDILN